MLGFAWEHDMVKDNYIIGFMEVIIELTGWSFFGVNYVKVFVVFVHLNPIFSSCQ